MSDIPATRVCSKCRSEKPLTPAFWYKNKGAQFGLATNCKECHKIHVRNYGLEHRERRRFQHRQWQEQNRQYVRERNVAWLRAHPEYVKANRDKVNQRLREQYRQDNSRWIANHHNRRARKLALPDKFTKEQWAACLLHFNHCCAVCGRQLRDLFGDVTPEADHWISLKDPRSDNPGTVATNMLPLCITCNRSKHDSDPIVWLERKFGKRKAAHILARIQSYFDSVRGDP